MRFAIAFMLLVILPATAEAGKKKRIVVSEETCQQIRGAVQQYGVAIVEAGAAARGFTKAQITQVRAHCR